jgi:cell division protein FtsZ
MLGDNVLNLPGIVIMGMGDVGNNIVSRIHRSLVSGADTIAVNTDIERLNVSQADKRILIGKALKGGLGTGGCPTMGRCAAERGITTINTVIESADLVFIAAGLGGGTGSGSIPLMAKVARENRSLVICFVTLPSESERFPRLFAKKCLKETLECADSVVVLDCDTFIKYCPALSQEQVYQKMDQIISETIRGITELVTVPSLINVDFADIQRIFKKKGLALLLVGESEEWVLNKNESVTLSSQGHPTANIDYQGALGSLVCISGGSNVNLFDAEEIATSITYTLDPHADVVWGLSVKNELEGEVRVLAVMTGLKGDADIIFS